MKAGTPSAIPTPSPTFVDSSNPEAVEVGVDLGSSWSRVVGEGMLCRIIMLILVLKVRS